MIGVEKIKSIYLKMLKILGISENELYYIAGADKLPAPLSSQEEQDLLKSLKILV